MNGIFTKFEVAWSSWMCSGVCLLRLRARQAFSIELRPEQIECCIEVIAAILDDWHSRSLPWNCLMSGSIVRFES